MHSFLHIILFTILPVNFLNFQVDKLTEELRRLTKQTEEKEAEMKSKNLASGGGANKIGKKDLKKYGAMVREKIESYKKMREELGAMRSGESCI